MPESASHVNFYENIAEVGIRLKETVVMYDNKPFYVLCAAEHADGIIRLYLDDLDHPEGLAANRLGVPHNTYSHQVGSEMDKFLKTNPECGIQRKMMNSPHFNKFRPFPLGMCNYSGKVVYVERAPQRHTHQGLTQQMIHQSYITLAKTNGKSGAPHINVMSKELTDTILNRYPSLDETIENLLDPRNNNEGAAFHRNFALMRGPMDSLYLAYKHDIIGLLPYGDKSQVRLGAQYRHARQAVEELRQFKTVE